MKTVLTVLALALAAPAAGAPGAIHAPAGAGAAGLAVARALPFVSDDYQKALAQARARNVPLVVDVWAPW
jgi:hypothetical protein